MTGGRVGEIERARKLEGAGRGKENFKKLGKILDKCVKKDKSNTSVVGTIEA